MDHVTVLQFCVRISELLDDKLGAGTGSLHQRAARVKRSLPKDVRANLDILIEAEAKIQDPRISMQVDPSTVIYAFKRCQSYLETLDPEEEKITRRYKLAASAMLQILVIFVLFIFVMRWAGYL